MRAKSPEKRCRQKPAKQPTYRVETERNPETTPQYFQISINILEARKLTWSNPNSASSYVIVVLGKKKHRTSIRRKMEEPCYQEYFMFEQCLSIRDIQKSSIWLAVMEPRCYGPPRLMGEATIDLGVIWSQPHHQVFHKWAQLCLPRNPAAGAVGFLKVDISILFRGDIQVMPLMLSNNRVEETKSFACQDSRMSSGYQTFQAIVPSVPKYADNSPLSNINDLLLPTGSEQQPANYIITVYAVYNLPSSAHGQPDGRRYAKQPTTFVRVSFCGLTAKTAAQSRTFHPSYCEQFNIVEMFPNMSELITLEVCNGEGSFNRALASAHLNLGHVSHDGENGFLPTFGPSLLHMYGTTTTTSAVSNSDDGAYHRGAMLVSLKTIVPYYQQGLRTTGVEPVASLQTERLWLMEDFCIFCPILEVSRLDRRICGKSCGVAMTIGELPHEDSGDEEFTAMMNEIKNRKLYYTGPMEVVKNIPVYGYLEFDHYLPVLQLATRLPDFRFRMYRNNMVIGIVTELVQSLNEVERRFKSSDYSAPRDLMEDLIRSADDTAANILKFLDIIQYSNPGGILENNMPKYSTELDQKQLSLQKEEAEKIYQQLSQKTKCVNTTQSLINSITKTVDPSSSSRKDVKAMLAEMKSIVESLNNLIFKTSEGWPDIVVWRLNRGSRVAYYRISVADIIYSVIPEQNGRNCGQIQTIYLKPLKCPKHAQNLGTSCFCIAGKVELLLWMGPYRHIHAFENNLPKDYKLRVKNYDMCISASPMMLECRVFIYRAKINTNYETSHLTHTLIRVNVLSSVKETKLQPKTTTPIWNQVIKLQKLVPSSYDRLNISPTRVLMEVFDSDLSDKQELIGRVEVHPLVDDRCDYDYAPQLKWYDIYKGSEQKGQILMSVQLVPIQETLLKSTLYNNEESFMSSTVKDGDIEMEDVEPLPLSLIPKSDTYKVDIYWWGLRDVSTSRKPCVVLEIDDLVIKSDVVPDTKSNCNFPNGRSSQICQAPLNEAYSPPLSVRLYDSSTFGRTLFLGANIFKNPNKYVVTWIPKMEREASLRSVSISASNFFQVSQVLYIRKSSSHNVDDHESNTSIPKGVTKTKRSFLKLLLCGCEENEEEFVLLPTYCKEKDQIKVLKHCPVIPEKKDWWTRYFSSIKDDYEENGSTIYRISIYPSELECQPEFSKFKDWCATLKLYNGKKTGIPEKDDQLYCGFLKAGIAIYRWPPPDSTIAVSCNGVDLRNGYFNDYPCNKPTKFLIRVYVVKADNLLAKTFSGKLDPYVAINCGNKHIGDRKSHVKGTLNPIFGKMYEIRCTLPDEYLLTVSLYDYDTVPPDELIGSTTIDLEDRIYSKHRARVGLATEYNSTGPNKWRDCVKPSIILEELCHKNHLPSPMFPDAATVIVNGVEYRDNEKNDDRTYQSSAERKENICLSLLHKWHTLPICGHHLVPEHVETRVLYNTEKPGVGLGKLQMWVDVFPLDSDVYIPPPLDITPGKLEEYELRVIIWDIQDMKLDERGKKVSDIYVRAWLDTVENAQYTDIHYGSEGEGSFNWRMIFHFFYHHAEMKLVRKEKGPFTEVEEHFPPIFVVQVLDSDSQVPDDFLASLSFNLNAVPKGMKLARHCKLDMWNKAKKVNLFSSMSIRAWWPLIHTNRKSGQTTASGVIDLELTLLPKAKAILMPVGFGREPPAPLPTPNRTASSHGIHLSKSVCFQWQREHTLVTIGVFVMLVLLLSVYLEIPQILWSEFVHDS